MILGRCTRDSFPGPVFRLAVAYGLKNASACCPVVWITAFWRSARPPVRHGRSEKGRGAMALSLDAAAEVFREAMRDTVKRYALWYLIQGVLLIAAGVLAIIYPVLSSAAVVVLLGWLLIISGVVQGLSLIGARHVPHFWLQLISVILAVLIGCLFLRDPAQGLMTIALLLIVFFMIEGISKVVFALTIRPFPNWGWVLASGLVGILLALILWANLPVTALWLVGVLLGINLISVGAAIAYLAWQVRQS